VQFCMMLGWSRLVSLCLCGSVWISAGLCWPRYDSVVLCAFGLVSAGKLRLGVLHGSGLVSVGLGAFVWFCLVLGWSPLALLRLFGSVYPPASL
jgi:hypothetical protein